MQLLCQRCGHRGSGDLSFAWHSETIEREGGRKVTAWLCPDCKSEFRSNAARTRFLRGQVESRGQR